MKSIRLSLVLYFLVLLAAGLGAVSVLAYHSTERTLRANEEARGDLLREQYKEKRRQLRERLDYVLKLQASILAERTRFQFSWSRLRLAPLGLLSVGLDPASQLMAPIWLAGWGRGPLSEYMHRNIVTQLEFHEEDLSRHEDGQVPEYFQINSDLGGLWRSRSMGEQMFPFDLAYFAKWTLNLPEFDETELRPDPHRPAVRVRRVRLKATVARFGWFPPPRRRRLEERSAASAPPPRRLPAGPLGPVEHPARAFPVFRASSVGLLGSPLGQGPLLAAAALFPGRSFLPPPWRLPGGPPGPVEHPAPAIFIQCAAETTHLDQQQADLDGQLGHELEDLKADSAAALATFGNRLLLISLTTFAATVLGGFCLVRLGLAPLRRLSEAVSRVSARDFRLPLDDRRLPRELRPIAARLKETLELLKRAFAREKQAAADISHELRTPLAALLTTLDVGLRKPRSPEEYRELLSDCRAAGKHMSQLVERLLTLARLDAGVDTLRPEAVDVNELAEQCASLVRPLAEARDVRLRVHRNGLSPVRADPSKLREILTNLLHNAIEYNRPHGTIDLTVQRQDGCLHLEVRDTGIGIPAAARGHLFERFYRADPSRQADGLHAGLGLAIVKGYVDLMGGTITVDSAEGQGSTFRLQLPAS